jgi:hypothetical protein
VIPTGPKPPAFADQRLPDTLETASSRPPRLFMGGKDSPMWKIHYFFDGRLKPFNSAFRIAVPRSKAGKIDVGGH